MELGRRKAIKQKDARSLLEQFSEEYGSILQFSEKEPKIETLNKDDWELIFMDGKPSVVKVKGRLYPTLVFSELLRRLPKIVVDMGAIPHVCNGADIMAPGVKRIEDDFTLGAVVVVADDRYGKFLAIGETTGSSHELKKIKQGKVALNKHYVGDDIWKLISGLKA